MSACQSGSTVEVPFTTAPARAPAPRFYAGDPSAHLEQVFEEIHFERMAGIPIVNEAIGVAAVGFRPFEGRWLGVMITPWFINLMMLPLDPGQWLAMVEGERRELPLPSGDYPFVGGHEEAIGAYLFCSLASPVREFHSHEQALAVAADVMELLLLPTVDRTPAPDTEAAGQAPGASSPCGRRQVRLSRRGFLDAGFEGLGAGRRG